MLEVCCFFGVTCFSCVFFADLYSTDIGFSDVKIPLFEDCIARYSVCVFYHFTYMYTLLDQ